jgi:hypothetical protein
MAGSVYQRRRPRTWEYSASYRVGLAEMDGQIWIDVIAARYACFLPVSHPEPGRILPI